MLIPNISITPNINNRQKNCIIRDKSFPNPKSMRPSTDYSLTHLLSLSSKIVTSSHRNGKGGGDGTRQGSNMKRRSASDGAAVRSRARVSLATPLSPLPNPPNLCLTIVANLPKNCNL